MVVCFLPPIALEFCWRDDSLLRLHVAVSVFEGNQKDNHHLAESQQKRQTQVAHISTSFFISLGPQVAKQLHIVSWLLFGVMCTRGAYKHDSCFMLASLSLWFCSTLVFECYRIYNRDVSPVELANVNKPL